MVYSSMPTSIEQMEILTSDDSKFILNDQFIDGSMFIQAMLRHQGSFKSREYIHVDFTLSQLQLTNENSAFVERVIIKLLNM